MLSRGKPTLPTYIISLVFRYLPQEDLAPSVRCNKFLYQVCNPLLYRDIHLHKPTQLFKLSCGENIIPLLGHTKRMFIDDYVLCLIAWENELPGAAHPARFLVNVWRATTSLSWLQICRSNLPPLPTGPILHSGNVLYGHNDLAPCQALIQWAANDSTLLPQLTFGVMIEPKRDAKEVGPNRWWLMGHFEDLFKHRPIKLRVHLSISTLVLVTGAHGSPQVTPRQVPPDESHWRDLASDIKGVFEELESGPWFLALDVTLGSHVDISNLHDFGRWLVDLVASSTIASPNLKALSIRLNGSVTASQLFAFTKQPKLFELFDGIVPILESIMFFLPNQEVLQWWKAPKTMHRGIGWTPVISHPHLRQELLEWWIEKLTGSAAGTNPMEVPSSEVMKRLIGDLYESTRFGRDLKELTEDMLIQEVLVYYRKKFLLN